MDTRELPMSEFVRYADILAVLGTGTRLRIVRLLLSAHPQGMVVGEIGEELGIAPSTLADQFETQATKTW